LSVLPHEKLSSCQSRNQHRCKKKKSFFHLFVLIYFKL
jgi:hypothetical protein